MQNDFDFDEYWSHYNPNCESDHVYDPVEELLFRDGDLFPDYETLPF